MGFYENFERTREHLTKDQENDSAVKGLLQTGKQMHDFLKSEGLEKIEAEGKKFDPNIHEALEVVESKPKILKI